MKKATYCCCLVEKRKGATVSVSPLVPVKSSKSSLRKNVHGAVDDWQKDELGFGGPVAERFWEAC